MEIDDDVEFQRRVWVAQRIGWTIIGTIVAAGLAGIFGNGPLSRASTGGATLRLEYERFGRLHQSTKLRCLISGGQPDIEIALNRGYLNSVRIKTITPEPVQTEAAENWLVYRFAGSAPMYITFDLKPEDFGSLAGSLRTAAGETLSFHQFIYP